MKGKLIRAIKKIKKPSFLIKLQMYSNKDINKDKTKKFPTGLVFAIVIITALLMLAVSSSVELNERTLEISALKKEITKLETERKAYELLLDKKVNLVEIDEYASYTLGMIKGDYTEILGVTERGEDVIESYSGTYREGSMLESILKSLSEKFTESWNNLLR